ncbi:MAG: hypothetical protein NZO16_02080 [Deltaproteobacteria bacterium]|nr:hypothetical protein [Deltaproteobacteria bacterium]
MRIFLRFEDRKFCSIDINPHTPVRLACKSFFKGFYIPVKDHLSENQLEGVIFWNFDSYQNCDDIVVDVIELLKRGSYIFFHINHASRIFFIERIKTFRKHFSCFIGTNFERKSVKCLINFFVKKKLNWITAEEQSLTAPRTLEELSIYRQKKLVYL